MFRFSYFFVFLAFYAASFAQDVTRFANLTLAKVHRINIETEWTATGDSISIGDTLNIMANGIANTAGKDSLNYSAFWIGPEGNGTALSYFPVPDNPCNSLIGKIGDNGIPFYIGRCFSGRIEKSGRLYLGYNDVQFDDNLGYYIVYVFSHKGIIVGVQENTSNNFLTSPKLLQNYPNPFNPNTNIEYQIAKQGNVEIGIYDINGRLVKSLLNSTQHAGSYTIQWNGQDEGNKTVASGTYFYQVKSDGVQLVKKMLMLK